MKNVSCMLCGSKDAVTVATKADYTESFTNVCCKRCGLVYANPRPTDEDLAKYYQGQFIQGRHEIKTVEQARERAARKGSAKKYKVDGLTDSLNEHSRVLEIGCSYGFLLNAIRKAVGCYVEGVEPSSVSGAYAKEEFGFPVFHGTAESYISQTQVTEKKFDLIILYHVLEHIADPVSVLKKLKKRLAPGGRLYVCVPDVTHLQEPPETFFQIPHIFNFSPWTLHVTLWRAGFKIIKLQRKLTAPKSGMEIMAVDVESGERSISHETLTIGSDAGSVQKSLRTASLVYGSMRRVKQIISKFVPKYLLDGVSLKIRKIIRRVSDAVG